MRDMREVLGDQDVPSWEREQRGVRTNIREFEVSVAFAVRDLGPRCPLCHPVWQWLESYIGAVTRVIHCYMMQAKLNLMQRRLELRLALTKERKLPLPRLVLLCERLSLDDFERSVVVMLIGNTVSPLIKEVLRNFEQGASGRTFASSEHMTVKTLLQAFCTKFKHQVLPCNRVPYLYLLPCNLASYRVTLHRPGLTNAPTHGLAVVLYYPLTSALGSDFPQVSHRAYFYKSSNLLRTGVLRLSGSQYRTANLDPDLTTQIASITLT